MSETYSWLVSIILIADIGRSAFNDNAFSDDDSDIGMGLVPNTLDVAIIETAPPSMLRKFTTMSKVFLHSCAMCRRASITSRGVPLS